MVWKAIARLAVRRPAVPIALLLAFVAASSVVIVRQSGFDSEVLNLLPAENTAVNGLRIYNNEFAQAGELAFLVYWDSPPPDAVALHRRFVDLLVKEPWVERVLAASPLETPDQTLGGAATPLLLNLPPKEFETVLGSLAPANLSERIVRLARRAASGSPAALLELERDPLGILAPAAGRVASTINLEQNFNLESDDGLAFIVPTATRQRDGSAESCRNLMREVHAFIARAEANLGPDAPGIGVTGRSAYVDEISSSMQRDLAVTSGASAAAVMLIFLLGFRRLLPLAGILLILALCAAGTLAAGILIFKELNIIAISFCSILFGLGDDFCLLLCQRFYQARADGLDREAATVRALREAMPGIFWVATTTAIGFLALCFSGSAGFAQLGVLVAIGVVLCAVLMPLLQFLFLRDRHGSESAASTGFLSTTLAGWHTSPVLQRLIPAAIFCASLLVAIFPWRALHFDLSPASLEPRDTSAAQTLARMMKSFPDVFEPLIVLIPSPGTESLAALDGVLEKLRQEGNATQTSSPSALVLNPARFEANSHSLATFDPSASVEALEQSIAQSGLDPGAFETSRSWVRSLSQIDGNAKWSAWLPPSSPWWFLINRSLAPDSPSAAAFLQLPDNSTPAARMQIAKQIEDAVPGSIVTGWSQMLVSLTPWARGELLLFGGSVLVAILFVLAVAYRDSRLWGTHLLAMAAAAAGTVATLKLLGLSINLLNVLAFPLILAVGVDYATHILLTVKERDGSIEALAGTAKAVGLSGLTTAAGFGALALAKNPALAGLGILCATGVLWSLAAALLIAAPVAAARIQSGRAG